MSSVQKLRKTVMYVVTLQLSCGIAQNSEKSTTHMSCVMRKQAFCICENKDADQLRDNHKLISAFVFATRIVQSLYFLNQKFQASSHLLWLYSLVCVGPGRKPRRPVFSQRGSYNYVGHFMGYLPFSTYCTAIQWGQMFNFWINSFFNCPLLYC